MVFEVDTVQPILPAYLTASVALGTRMRRYPWLILCSYPLRSTTYSATRESEGVKKRHRNKRHDVLNDGQDFRLSHTVE